MNKIIALSAPALLLALSACAQQTAGAGQTSDGRPLSGHVSFTPVDQMWDVDVVSPAGWTCNTNFEGGGGRVITSQPLECDDGRSGTITLTLNQIQNQMVGSFELEDGESGQVTFGRT